MAGWGDFLGGLMNKIPIQGRKERIKNKIANLEAEKKRLLNEFAIIDNSRRLECINDELKQLRQQQANFE